ncbi:phage tail protein [Lactococcus raffinolactis]|uniref:phage tail protein n=1 Tax=Pseudolactococcus raffinolactis TaxID=1366 RepID=UPI0039A3C94C
MASNAKFEVEIYGNTAQFENSLKGINTAMSALRSEASSLKNALKLDPTNTTLMTKLQNNLATQLEQTKNKTTQLKTELAGIDKSTPDGQKKFLQLSRAIQDSETRAGYLERDIKNLDSSISSGSFNLKLKTDDAESGLSRVKSGFGGLKTIAIGALLEIGSKIATTIGGKFGDWVNGAVDTQKAMIALKNTMNFSGNGAEYDALSSRMQKLAQDTNANASDAIKLATTFVGLGNSSEVAGNKVDSLIRANQAFGGSSEDLKSVAQAYSQMSASGKVSAENINQLTDANTALGSALKTEIMKNPALASFGSFAEASEKGAVSVDMLDTAMANLGKSGGGGTTTIKDSFDSLDETISNALLPALDSITPIIVEIVNGIADSIPKVAQAFKDLYNWIKQNWDWLSKVLIVIGSLIAIFGVLNGIIAIFGVVMAVATSPITLIVLGITALIAIGVLLWKNWESIANFAKSIWGGIKGFFSGLGTWFSELWQGITTAFQNAWNSVVSFLSGIVEGIKGFFAGLGTWFGQLWTGITTTIQNVWNAIVTTIQTVVTNIIAFFQPLTNFFTSIFGLIGAVIELAWQLILAGARAVWAGITTVFSAVVGFFTPIFQAVGDFIGGVFSAIGQFAQNAWNFIVSVFSAVVGWFSGVFNSAAQIISSVFSAIGGFASNAWSQITSVFSAVVGWFSGVFNSVSQTVSNVFNSFAGFAQNAWNGITSAFGKVGSWFADIFNGIKDTVDNVFGGITKTIENVTGTISGITDKVKGLFGGSTIVMQREFADLKARGLTQNSSSVTNKYENSFTIKGGRNDDPTAIARAVRREFELGRA